MVIDGNTPCCMYHTQLVRLVLEQDCTTEVFAEARHRTHVLQSIYLSVNLHEYVPKNGDCSYVHYAFYGIK